MTDSLRQTIEAAFEKRADAIYGKAV